MATLDAMLPQHHQQAEETRQLARLRTKEQQLVDASRYDLRRRDDPFNTGDGVWVGTPIRRRGLCEKLLKRKFGPHKVLRLVGEVHYEVVSDDDYQPLRRQPHSEVVHVVV